jgi:hypothetical protein
VILRRRLPGLKPVTEALDSRRKGVSGRGAIYTGRSGIVRRRGQYRWENVGMSNERRVRIPPAENLRFPGEGSSALGKSGPKPRTKVVGDGQRVKIPVPPNSV